MKKLVAMWVTVSSLVVTPAFGESAAPAPVSVAPAPEAAPADDPDVPEVDTGLVVAQVSLGLVGGAAAAWGGGTFGAWVASDRQSSGNYESSPPSRGLWTDHRGALLGAASAATLAMPAVVYLVGRSSERGVRGSYLASLGGTAAGMALGLAAYTGDTSVGLLVLGVAPIMGAVIGYHATRTRVDGGRVATSLYPMLVPTRDGFAVSLASGSF